MSQGNFSDTLTRVMYSVMDKLYNEPIGLLTAVSRNVSNVTRVKFGSSIQSRIVGDITVTTASSYTPTMTLPEGDSTSDTHDTFALDTVYSFGIPLNGEEELDVNNSDQPFSSLLGQKIARGMRQIRNAAEADIAGTGILGACRAIGTAGTTPFATNFNEVNGLRKAFIDNGVGQDGSWSIVMDTAAGLNLRNLAQLQQVNTSGDANLLRQGILLPLSGFTLRESAGIQSHTAASGTGFLVNHSASDYAAGTTSIVVDTGTGTLADGDVITFEGDTNKYVIASASLTGSAGSVAGTIVLNKPGLRQTLSDGVAITKLSSYTGNLALTRDAIEFASRAPVMPSGGDAAGMHQTITDPLSGMVFDYAVYKGNGTNTLKIQTMCGTKVWHPQELAILLG